MIDGIQFESFAEFIEMGGYAFNVWSVYSLFLIFLAANLFLPLVKQKQILRELKRRNVLNQEYGKNSGDDKSQYELGE